MHERNIFATFLGIDWCELVLFYASCFFFLRGGIRLAFCLEQNEVKRAIELREIVTSLGPAYIKLGQALSIRPDILSPSAMTELQKLCDKVKATACLFL